MIEVIQNIFGVYTPIHVYDEAGALIKVMPDFGYIAAVVIFCIVLYSVFRIIGSVISR